MKRGAFPTSSGGGIHHGGTHPFRLALASDSRLSLRADNIRRRTHVRLIPSLLHGGFRCVSLRGVSNVADFLRIPD